MAISFDAADCEQVRKAIDISLTSSELTDETIKLDIYKGDAEAAIDDALSNLTNDQKTAQAADIKRAVMNLTAAYIAPKVPHLTSETLEGDKWTFQNKDYSLISEQLENKASVIVARILKAVAVAPAPVDTSFAASLFTTAKANPK